MSPESKANVDVLIGSHITQSLGELQLAELVGKPDPEIENRQYQQDCLAVLAAKRAAGGSRSLIHMATGLGKTTVIALDAKRYLEEKPEARVLFLCHQNDILEQAQQRFAQVLGPDKTYGFFTGTQKDTQPVDCLFASFQTMREWKNAFLTDEFDYIAVDEGHHAKASTYEPTLHYFQPDFLVGLTGTPDRKDLKDIRELFGPEDYSKSLTDALAENLLATPDYRVILDDIQEDILDDVADASLAELNRKLFIPKRDEEIAEIIHEKINEVENPRSLIFCPSIDHAERMAQIIPGSHTYHSGQTREDRKKLLKAFRTGEVSTLLTIVMFNEGIDIPDANVVVFLRSTQSRTIFMQQLGRGLRKTETKTSVLVLDFVANCDRLLMVEDLLEEAVAHAEQARGISDGDGKQSIGRAIREAKELQLGSFEFTETSRRIMQLVHEAIETRDRIRKWTMQDSITYYRDLYEKVGRLPSILDIQRASKAGRNPSPVLLLRDFDSSIEQLRRAAGIEEDLRNFWHGWTAEDSVDYYNALAEILGRSPRVQDINEACARGEGPGSAFLGKHFGNSIPKLKEAAGHVVKTRGRTWDADMSVEYYQSLAEKLGRTPTERDIRDASLRGEGPSVTLLFKDHKTITGLREAAGGFADVDARAWTQDRFIDYYKQLSEELGHAATVNDIMDAYRAGNGPHVQSFYRHDLKIPQVKKLAGYDVQKSYTKWSQVDIAQYMGQLASTIGRSVTPRDIEFANRAGKGPSVRAVNKMMQSLNDESEGTIYERPQ